MQIVEALVLFVFGILLPTWDVGSDVALSHSFITTKICELTWREYVRDYRNGVEPPVNQNIGEFLLNLFKSFGKPRRLITLIFRQILQLQ